MGEPIEVELVLPAVLSQWDVDEALLAEAMSVALPRGLFPDLTGRTARSHGEVAPGRVRWTASFRTT
ncbi:hypothetical protein GCM10027047_07230 [Rhodococcus aerolatus]